MGHEKIIQNIGDKPLLSLFSRKRWKEEKGEEDESRAKEKKGTHKALCAAE